MFGFLANVCGNDQEETQGAKMNTTQGLTLPVKSTVGGGGNASLFLAVFPERQAILAIHCFHCFLTTAFPFKGQPRTIGWRGLQSAGGTWPHLKTLVTFPKSFLLGCRRCAQTPASATCKLWTFVKVMEPSALQFSNWKDRKGGRERSKAISHGCCETS